MRRVGVLTAILALLAVVAGPQLGVSQVARADSSTPRQMTLVLADAEAVRQAENGVELTQSLVGLVAALRNDRFIAFMTAETPSDIVGPFRGSNVRLPEFEGQIARKLRTPSPRPGSLLEAVAEAYAVLAINRAAPGSSLYLVTGDASSSDFSRHLSHVPALAAQFAANGWRISGLSLPGSSDGVLQFMGGLAADTGGQLFELSVADDLGRLGDAMLSHDASGSLSHIGSRSLRFGEVMSTRVTVPPGTREATFLIFKSSAFGSLVLTNPSGFNVSPTDLRTSRVIETPHMVAWRLVDPTPGSWRIDARGLTGLVSKWSHSTNTYSLVLRASGPLALGEPTGISAYVKDGDGAAVLDAVRMLANVTSPDGSTQTYEMRDEGTGADAVAGDGYFAMILPPLRAQGTYDVELELTWLRYDHSISSLAQFKAQAFPTIDVQPVAPDQMAPGERTKVATVSVHVDGDPYPVDVGTLAATLVSQTGRTGTIELEPRRLYGDGPAWQFDVFFTMEQEGYHSLAFRLELAYAGRTHTHTSGPLALSAAIPAAPNEPAAAGPAPVQAAAPASQPDAPETTILPPKPDGFPWGLVVTMGVLLIAGGGAAGYWLTRTPPQGYLYDDRGKPLVDFSKVERHPLLNLIFRNTVRGSDLGVPGLDGLMFQFSGNRVRVRSYGEHPTVRVNNQPLVGEASVYDRTWIGTGGKLFTFLRTPLAVPSGGSED